MMMRRSGISYLMSHHRLGLCKGNKFSHTLKQRHRRQPRPRPDWDDTIHDLSIFKLSEAQLEARTKLFRCRHLHRSRSSFGKGRCFSVSKEQPDLSNASNKSEDAKAIFVAENRTDSVLSQSNPIVPKENVEVKAEIMAKDEKNFHQTKGYDKAFDLANNQENTKVMVSYKKNRCKSLPFIPRLKILRIQALPPSERYQDGTGAQNHPNFGLLTEHGLSATSTPTVDFEDEIRCFEVCKGVIPCSEQGAQCNLTGDAKVCKNGKYGSSCSIKRSQYGMFSKMASYKQEGVFRQKKQDIFKCVRKLGEQEPSKKDKGQRARCANATCSKSYKRYVANSTRKELDNVNSKEPNIAKRYFGFIQRTIPTGECKVNADKSQDTCALSKIELRYLRQEIRMYLKGQMDLLKEFKDFKSVIAFKLENIQSEIQRLSKIQLEPTDCRDKLMDTEKKNPTSLDQPLKEIDGHLEDGMQPQGKKLVLVAKESISPHVSCGNKP